MSAASDDHDVNDIDSMLDYDEDNHSKERANECLEPDSSSIKDFLYSLQRNMTAQTAMLSTLVAEQRGEKRASDSNESDVSKRRKHHNMPCVGLTNKASEKPTTSTSREAPHSASEKANSYVSELDNDDHSNELNEDDQLCLHGQENDPDFSGSVSDEEDNTSLLTKIDEALAPSENHSPQVNEKLSQLVNAKFVMDLDLEKRKQLSDKYKTPKNCDVLFVPTVNPEIWGKLNAISKQRDIKMSILQDLLIRVSNAIITSTDTLLDCRAKKSTPDYKTIMSNLMDCVALIGHVHKELSYKRRDQLRPNLSNEFKPACSRSNKIEKSLFGDDLSKVVQDLKTTSKVVNNITNVSHNGKSRASGTGNNSNYAPRQHFLSRQGRNQQYPPRSNRFYKNQPNQTQTKKKFMRT